MTEFFTPEKDKPQNRPKQEGCENLPWALLLGDSISCGYTEPVKEILRGQWNVERAPTNCGDTTRGLELIDEWLGDRHWDVIHFNWGLHDLCYRHPDSQVYGHRDKWKGTQTMSAEAYGQNLDALVTRMESSGNRLIWATTTIIPSGEAGRYEGDELRYNQVAAEIMSAHSIETNDLYALTATFGPELFSAPCDVHFSDEGNRSLARQVAHCIAATGA